MDGEAARVSAAIMMPVGRSVPHVHAPSVAALYVL